MGKILGIVIAVVFVLGGGGYVLATRANAATPGDTLFKLDLILEDIQRFLTVDDVKKTELEQLLLEERENELNAILGEEDISKDVVEDCMEYMNTQRIRTYERLGEVQQKLEEKGNEQAAQSLERVQNQYMEHLEKQVETATKAQERFNGVGEEVKNEIQNSISESKGKGKN